MTTHSLNINQAVLLCVAQAPGAPTAQHAETLRIADHDARTAADALTVRGLVRRYVDGPMPLLVITNAAAPVLAEFVTDPDVVRSYLHARDEFIEWAERLREIIQKGGVIIA